MRRAVAMAAAALALWAVHAAPVRAQDAAPTPMRELATRMEEGYQQFQDLEYRGAIETLRPLRNDPRATRAQKLRALELIGISHLVLGEKTRATEAFEDLLTIDAGYQLQHDDGSPKIQSFFDDVKRAFLPGFEAGMEARLEHSPPRVAVAGRAVEFEAVVRVGLERVKEIVLKWRRGGVLRYRDAPMRRAPDDKWHARFRAPGSRSGYPIDYYVEARNAAGGPIGRIGGPETPLALEVRAGEADADRPWYARWYVIAGGTALVVGVAATAIVLSSEGSVADGSLEPGRITVSP